MNQIIKDAAVGLSFAGIGSSLLMFFGYSRITFTVILYLVVAVSVFQGFRYSDRSLLSFDNPLNRLVLVVEGEEMKLKRLLTGEKYKIKGDVEKL